MPPRFFDSGGLISACSFFDSDGLISACTLELAQLVLSIALLPFALVRAFALVREPRTSWPRRKYTSLCLSACLWPSILSSPFSIVHIPFIVCFIAVELVQYLELGRVRTPFPEILWFYLGNAVFALSWLVREFTVYDVLKISICTLCLILEIHIAPAALKGYDQSTIFGKICVSYVSDLLQTASYRQLDRNDFAKIPAALNSSNTYRSFAYKFERAKLMGEFRVLYSLISVLKTRILMISVLDALSDLVTYSRPLVLALFLSSLQRYRDGDSPIYLSYYLALLLGSIQIIATSLSSIQSLISNMSFVTSRSSLMGAIYRKAVNLSPSAKEKYDSSKIMNLLNVDTAMVQLAYRQIPILVSAPLGLVVCTWQLYHFMGVSSLAALPLYLLFIPYSGWYTKRMFTRFPKLMAVKDERTKATWSVFQNIKSLKLYAWERPYADKVMDVRQREIGIQAQYLRLQSAMNSVFLMLGDFVAASIFIAFLWWTGKALTPEIVFPTLSLLSFLSEPFFAFPRAVSSVGRAITSQKRINEFLSQPEHTEKNFYRTPSVPDDDFTRDTILVETATIYWTENAGDAKLALKDLDLSLRRGDLCCIIGKVGSGKTALAKALCGQISIEKGSITVRGTSAFCSQEPWLQFKSIRDNILFGLSYDEEFYQKTLEACQLLSDLEILPEGDETEIGEKGLSLSGGQKARVALARAVYSRADTYVLDDVLASVDQHVAAKLVESLFTPYGLLSGKTIVLTTNYMSVLQYASKVVTLDAGSVKEDSSSEIPINGPRGSTPNTVVVDENVTTGFDFDRHAQLLVPKDIPPPTLDIEAAMDAILAQQKLEEEDQQSDMLLVFKKYFAAVGKWTSALAVIFLLISVLASNLIVIWLTIWSDKNLTGIDASRYYVLVYLLLSLFTGATVYLSVYWFVSRVGNRAALRLHNKMLESVIRSPLVFFETTPLGAIMNRFTGDVSTMDSTLPNMIYFFSRAFLNMVISFAIMIGGAPLVTVIVIPLLLLYNSYRKHYIKASRQLQRMVSASRAPILSHIEESLKGLSTINSYSKTDHFINMYEKRSDYWMEISFLRASLSQWLNWRISCMAALMTLASATSMVLIVGHTTTAIGVVGVVLHSTQRGGMMLSRIIRSFADIEVSAVAVERVLEYSNLPSEAPDFVTATEPSVDWPLHGKVQLVDYSTRYRPHQENVLHNVNVSIASREKIGIVGRTGAGKSTVSAAIFRLLEATSGHITIDDVNTSQIGLYPLRSRLAIIPQDAQIFKGTVRSNLDPLSLTSDARLWQILQLCNLSEHFANLKSGLDTELFEGGDNLSRGQAQLICLGRSLVRESNVLILDEATASVDSETDQIVQRTIRAEFADKTIITIAHRLDTIMDSDRIAVLENGVIKEFDSPQNLLAAKGLFYDLVQAPGSSGQVKLNHKES